VVQCKLAQIHSEQTPQQYKTIVGERGITYLADNGREPLCRALLVAPVLILDDALSVWTIKQRQIS